MNQEIKPLKAVYSYFFPEVRKVLQEIDPAEVNAILMQSISPGLDNFHFKAIDTYVKYFASELPGLSQYKYQYVTSGASEGIFHLLAKLKAENGDKVVYVLKGEYEGYAGYGRNLGLNIVTVENPGDLKLVPKGTLFISSPSARDGNIIDSKEWDQILESGHEIIYDATYVGLTQPHVFNVSHPNIKAVICSLSKPFGLYYHRIGFVFSRIPLPTLEVNKWFKNINSLVIAQRILEGIPNGSLVTKYRPWQENALMTMEKQFGEKAKASDVILLANEGVVLDNRLEEYKRGNGYRFCLTPYFLNQELVVDK
jgi:histidinol-phosphate/aromatic aminotransferase/cobyric acid decarboxylase-like protein